jgi:hypothetical protein
VNSKVTSALRETRAAMDTSERGFQNAARPSNVSSEATFSLPTQDQACGPNMCGGKTMREIQRSSSSTGKLAVFCNLIDWRESPGNVAYLERLRAAYTSYVPGDVSHNSGLLETFFQRFTFHRRLYKGRDLWQTVSTSSMRIKILKAWNQMRRRERERSEQAMSVEGKPGQPQKVPNDVPSDTCMVLHPGADRFVSDDVESESDSVHAEDGQDFVQQPTVNQPNRASSILDVAVTSQRLENWAGSEGFLMSVPLVDFDEIIVVS